MLLDLRQGFGDFDNYKLFKFPDGSIKLELKKTIEIKIEDTYCIFVKTTLRTNDDIITLALLKDLIDNKYCNVETFLDIDYMMYQQDDRLFNISESFGLKTISKLINNMGWTRVTIFHPHSDKVELIDNCRIKSNLEFVKWAIENIGNPFSTTHWVIPDSGAFKTQYKQIEELKYPDFITCMKSRDHATGQIKTIVNCDDLNGEDCFIVDDICLVGRTFLAIAEELKKKNCGKLYLVVSHGVFNSGINQLLEVFDGIYTTNSICELPETAHEKLKIYKL